MCGIAGGVDIDDGGAKGAMSAIAHRGPDGQDAHREPVGDTSVWLGHTRLAILDLSDAGKQPMASADGRWLMTFNGEVYNHLDLRAALPDRPWRGHSDTETILEAVSEWGVLPTLRKLNGMFALCLVDRRDQVLYLARDPFGIKPLYHSGQTPIRFASEIDAVESLMGSRAPIDREALATFLTLRFVPSPSTLLQGIHKLAAGHVLTHSLGSSDWSIRPFASVHPDRFEGSFEEATTAYGAHLRAAVHRQMLSDVPVGVLLSGGIDSAVIAGLAREHTERLPTFSVGFGEASAECELADAADTAAALGIGNVGVICGPEDLWTALLEVVREVEEPLGTTSILPMWHLARRTRADVSVVLTGQGSDEPLGGYRRYQSELAREALPWPGAARVARPLARIPTMSDGMRRAIRALPQGDTAKRFVEAYSLFSPSTRAALIQTRAAPQADRAVRYWLDWLGETPMSSAERMMRIDTRMQLADDLLLYGDKVSMAVALETRVPMLDTDLVKFMESLPIEYRLKLRQTKRVHRAFAAQFLPDRIINRPKKGFNVPFRALCQKEWRQRIEDILLRGPHLEVLDRDAVRRIWNEHLHMADRTRQIFALLTLAMWWAQRHAL